VPYMTALLYELFSLALVPFAATAAASADQGGQAGANLDTIDQDIEDAVVRGDLRLLASIYADSLRYRHVDGQADTKPQRLADVERGGYVTRRIEGPSVEGHGDVALTSGRLLVVRTAGGNEDRYAVAFIRVYARRDGRWQLLSHRGITLEETPR
jgi:ketosteroid isomerase-like protein